MVVLKGLLHQVYPVLQVGDHLYCDLPGDNVAVESDLKNVIVSCTILRVFSGKQFCMSILPFCLIFEYWHPLPVECNCATGPCVLT